MFRMIRCGYTFNTVIMVSPPEAGPDTPDAKFYRYAAWQIGDHKPGVFNEINYNTAITYFSGIADGIGFEPLPEDTFPSLEAALQYVNERRITMHQICDNTSVGMLIRKDNRLLLIERKLFPFGFAPPAGHVDNKGGYEKAAKKEVQEEVGLNATKLKLVIEGKKDNKCRRKGGDWHYWKVYEVEAEGELMPSGEEVKQIGWYTEKQIKELAQRTRNYINGEISEEEWQKSPGIEIVWYEWFKQLKII